MNIVGKWRMHDISSCLWGFLEGTEGALGSNGHYGWFVYFHQCALWDGNEAFGFHVFIFLIAYLYLSAHVGRLVVMKLEIMNTGVAINWTMHSRHRHYSRFHRSYKLEGSMWSLENKIFFTSTYYTCCISTLVLKLVWHSLWMAVANLMTQFWFDPFVEIVCRVAGALTCWRAHSNQKTWKLSLP